MIRPFDLRDLPLLHRYRNRGLFLDSAQVMTRGPMLVSGVLLSYLAPSTGIFTLVCQDEEDEGQTLMGQVVHTTESPFARVSFLAPVDALDCSGLSELLDHLVHRAGKRGAFHLIAEVDDNSVTFESLRRAGFGVYARQRIWKLEGEAPDSGTENLWRPVRAQDSIAVLSHYHSLVPGLVKQIEPLTADHLEGLVSWEQGEVLGYVDLKYGHRGIWTMPIIHPDVQNVDNHLTSLLQYLPDRRSRPVYICVRSYQSWLESAVENIGAKQGPFQAVMVKHLAVRRRVKSAFALPQLEGQPDISAPIAQSKRNNSV
ncbi:MAG: hypothetical protein PVG14_05235 [Anaerolineales bacterium]